MTKRIFVDPASPFAEAFRAAIITLPGKFVLVDRLEDADLSALEMMPNGTLATWATSYFVADAEIDNADLSDKTIEITIESSTELTGAQRVAESKSVLVALGINHLEGERSTETDAALHVAGYFGNSAVSVANTLSLRNELRILITDAKLRVSLVAPLGITAAPAEIAGHDSDGTKKLRPLYRSVIARWLANY
jgi:hypothetical protein